MAKLKPNTVWSLILLGWIILNLMQAALTGLFDDEALFWMYGMHPAWGYYEHPPVVGILIRAGYTIIHNELGVRLLFVILTTLSVWLTGKMSGMKDIWLFAALAFTTVIVQAGGFMAAPDVALVFFTVLFFMIYRELLKKDNLFLSVIWGVVMACMIYSKYNGILAILFTIMSNFKLFRKRFFYIGGLTGIACMIPHILWSFHNGHPTVTYHLYERNFEQFNFLNYFGSYFLGQLAVYGPLAGFVFFWAMIVFKSSDTFDKSLKFTAIGTMLFFMAYTFRGKVEPNWTLPAFVPLIIMTYRVVEGKQNLRKLIIPVAGACFILMLAVRIYLIHDFIRLPRHLLNLTELYGWKEWSEEVEKKAAGRTVVFFNSYQRASKYIFYTGKPAYSMDDFAGHRTQYYYWGEIEESLQGKPVMVIDFVPWRWLPGKKAFIGKNGIITYYGFWDNFRSHYRLGLEFRYKISQLRFPANAEITIPVRILNPYPHPIVFNENRYMPTYLVYHIHFRDRFVRLMEKSTDITGMVIRGTAADTTIRFSTPSEPGKYYLGFSIMTGWVPPPKNMDYRKMEIY